MSDDTEKEGVVIDVTPEAVEPEAETVDAETPKPAAKKSIFSASLLIAIIALLLVVTALFIAYYYGQQATQDLTALNTRLETALSTQKNLQQKMAETAKLTEQQQTQLNQQQQHSKQQEEKFALAEESFARQEDLLNTERQRMQEREAKLRTSVAEVHQRVGSSSTQWMVAEAEYLLRIADHRLTLARDTQTAHSALQLADERLHDTQDPVWNTVRQQIARDLQTLKNVGLPDSTGMAAKLAAMAEQAPQLKLANATIGAQTPHPEPNKQTNHSERTWETLLDDLWTGFKSTVRIRRNDQPVQAMLPPEQQFFLYENLRLSLEAARLAIARIDPVLYRDNLSQAIRALQQYFDTQDTPTKAMLKTLNDLHKVDIRPAMPDISQSLRTLQNQQQLNAQLNQPLSSE